VSIDFKVTILTILLYSTLYSSSIICIVVFLRLLFGLKIQAKYRMVIWWISITSMVLLITFFHKENYELAYHLKIPWFIIPPIQLSLYIIGVKNDNYQLIGKTGQVYGVISSHDNLNSSVLFQGDITALLNWIIFIWIAGILIFWIWHLFGYAYLNKKISRIDYCEDEGILKRIIFERGIQGISSPMRVKLIPHDYIKGITCPCIVGIFNSTFVIIMKQWECLEPEDRDAIIMHELSHMKYHDNIKNLILLVLQSIHWFNPLIWLGLKYFRQDLEYLRDYQILKNTKADDKKKYAHALISVAKLCSVKYRSSMHSGMLSSSGLGFRVRLMLENKKQFSMLGVIVCIFTIAIFIAILLCGSRISFVQHATVWEFIPR